MMTKLRQIESYEKWRQESERKLSRPPMPPPRRSPKLETTGSSQRRAHPSATPDVALSPTRVVDRLPGPRVRLEDEPPPLSAFNDDPVLNTRDAAQVLGVMPDTLRKWRQRNQGPEYIQYGPDGGVLYVLSALMKFRDAHRVMPGRFATRRRSAP